jgi:hypothetical protein
MPLLLFFILSLASLSQSFSALGLLILDGLFPSPLALHVLLALLLLGDFLALYLLPGVTLMFKVVGVFCIIALGGEYVVEARQSGRAPFLEMLASLRIKLSREGYLSLCSLSIDNFETALVAALSPFVLLEGST